MSDEEWADHEKRQLRLATPLAMAIERRSHPHMRAMAAAGDLTLYSVHRVKSQSLWSRYDRHFVGVTRYNALS